MEEKQHHYHDHDLNKIVKSLWAKVCDEFVPKKEVYALAKELRDLDNEFHKNNNKVAKAIAAKVIEETQKDLDNLRDDVNDKLKHIKSFDIVLVPKKDNHGRPKVSDPKTNILYLCPSEINEYDDSWDEWIVIPERCHNKTKMIWERVGAQKIDLKWVKNDIESINNALLKLNNRISKVSNHLAKHILDNCIRPLEEIREYIKSEEFVKEIVSLIPMADRNTDGLMSANQVLILEELRDWQTKGWITVDEVSKIYNEN